MNIQSKYVDKRLNELRDNGFEPAVLETMKIQTAMRAVSLQKRIGAQLNPEQKEAVMEHAFRELCGEVAPEPGAVQHANVQEFYQEARNTMLQWPAQRMQNEVNFAMSNVNVAKQKAVDSKVDHFDPSSRIDPKLEMHYFEQVEKAASLARVIEKTSPNLAKSLRASYEPGFGSGELARRAMERVIEFEENLEQRNSLRQSGPRPKPRM